MLPPYSHATALNALIQSNFTKNAVNYGRTTSVRSIVIENLEDNITRPSYQTFGREMATLELPELWLLAARFMTFLFGKSSHTLAWTGGNSQSRSCPAPLTIIVSVSLSVCDLVGAIRFCASVRFLLL